MSAFRLAISDFRFQKKDFRRGISDFRLRRDVGYQIWEFKFQLWGTAQILDISRRVSEERFRISDLEFQIWDLRFQIWGTAQILGVRRKIPEERFHISDFRGMWDFIEM